MDGEGESLKEEGGGDAPTPPPIKPIVDAPRKRDAPEKPSNEAGNPVDHSKRVADWTRYLTIVTAVLAFVGACQLGAGVLQYLALRSQLGVMKAGGTDTHNIAVATSDFATAMKSQAENTGDLVAQTRSATSAARQSALATQGAASEAKRDSAIQTRAYVVVESGEVTNFKVGQIPNIHLHLKNTGATTAYKFRNWVAARMLSYPLKETFKIECYDPFPRDLGSGSPHEVNLPFNNPLSQNDFDAVKSGQKAIFIAGNTKYIDAFQAVYSVNIRLIFPSDHNNIESGVIKPEPFNIDQPQNCK